MLPFNILACASLVVAGVAVPGYHLRSAAKSIETIQNSARAGTEDFLISDLYINSVSKNSTDSKNITLQFVFSDPNSNTSTICTDTWTKSNTTDNAPYDYVLCSPNGIKEYYQWKLVSYASLDSFQLMFAHLFSDPVLSQPPYDVVELFSAPVNFTLACENAAGNGGCSLPEQQNPTHGIIDAISA